MEGDDIPNGWPLGLGNTNSTIRVAYTSLMAPPPPPRNPLLSCASVVQCRSSSFSLLSSSDLETESTASFFPDQSVSLGWLFGIRDKGGNEQRCVIHTPNVVTGSDLRTRTQWQWKFSRALCSSSTSSWEIE
ncbi:uncharacterized protein [Primulina huaijiensis]|uniref:uncharacterized protein n=1 Tax=Primulina huaijiensis TaxID=1492673 RepID=UPI003CC780A8